MGLAIILVHDAVMTSMDRLIESGRLPEKNIPAAKKLAEKFVGWVEDQGEGFIPVEAINYESEMAAFIDRAQKQFKAASVGGRHQEGMTHERN